MGSGRSQKAALIVCVILTAVLFGNGLYILSSLDRKKDGGEKHRQEKVRYEQNESSITLEEPVNLLVLGLDDDEARSDVILVINYSPSLGMINILSVPRDTRVYVKGRAVKINALISIGGERLVINSVEKLTGLDIHYYATVNFAAFRKIVDILGGVEFYVPFDMNYDDPDQNLHIHLKKGRQLLDGKKAEQLVRYRKGNKPNEGYEDADIGRIKMQQAFLKEMIRQKVKLKYISKIDDIFIVLRDHLVTNIGMGDLRRYIKYVGAIKPENVKTYTIPGDTAYIGKVWYYICDRKKTLELIEENFYK